MRSAHLRMGIRLSYLAVALGVALGTFTWLSAIAHNNGELTSGNFVMVAGYLGLLTGQLRFLSSAFIDLKRSDVALLKGQSYLHIPAQQDDPSGTPDTGKPVFEINGLTLVEGDKRLVEGLDWIVSPGSFTVICGPSGVGKTTLINTLLGLSEPPTGSIAFHSTPVGPGSSACILRHLAVAPQKATVISGSMLDNLTYGLEEQPDRQELEAVVQALGFKHVAELGLDTFLARTLDAQGSGLSGGERQRIAIGRALLRGKAILLLDEPTAALDWDTASQLVAFIRNRAETLILVTHDPRLANLADRILDLGRYRPEVC